jgi:hypothetical protein
MAEERLPEGTTVLERAPAEKSVELALEAARMGASDALVRALGGEEAIQALEQERDADPNGAG